MKETCIYGSRISASYISGVTRVRRGAGEGRTAPGDTLHGVTPQGEKIVGQIHKEEWINKVGQVKGAG